MKFILPDAALVQHLAITGKAGSGKTNAAKVMVERFLTERRRVCIIDPTGAWWGLQSNEAGRRAAYKVTIFGGAHGHFPLTENHGALLGELVATTDLPCILDTSEMGANERTRFMADFAETLYKKNFSNPLHLVIDECHEFAPQIPRTPAAGIMLNAVERMVTGGRVRGFRVMLISQRPAAVNKSVLTQVETMIVFRMTGAPDRRAVEDWVVANADKRTGAEILTSLASLPTGEGWVWSPESGILKRFKFPKSATYDSGRAPTGERQRVVLAKIDHGEIGQRLAAVAKDVEENDPKKLKAKIAELEKSGGKPDAEALQKAREAGRAEGLAQGRAETEKAVRDAVARAGDRLRALADELGAGVAGVVDDRLPARRPVAIEPRSLTHSAAPRVAKVPAVDGALHPAARKLLLALAQHAPAKFTWGQTATLAGLKPSGGHYNAGRKELRDRGLVDEDGDRVSASATGMQEAGEVPPAPSTPDERLAMWCSRLPSPAPEMLRTLVNMGEKFTDPADLGVMLDKKPTGGHWNSGIAVLRNNGLVEMRGRALRAAELLRG